MSAAPDTTVRYVALDVARCLALLGMMATHLLERGDLQRGPVDLVDLASGRSSALFAVLAGVSIALLSGREEPVRGRAWAAAGAGLAVRAVSIALIGLFLGEFDTGLAVILAYYGVLFLLAIPFLALRAPALAGLAVVWIAVGPVLSQMVRPHLPDSLGVPVIEHLATPGPLLADLLFTGYYPAIPWLAYLWAGMAVGRLPLLRRPVAVGLAALGAILAFAAAWLSKIFTDRDNVIAAMLPTAPYGETTIEQLRARIERGLYGTTPTGPWEWLLIDAPHSGTPFDLAGTIGSALLVIGGCLIALLVLPQACSRVARVMFGAGTMTLTLYSLHAILRTPDLWPPQTPHAYLKHAALVLGIGALFALAGRRGPLESVVGAAARAVRRSVDPPIRPRARAGRRR